jgi:hypothetical protein
MKRLRAPLLFGVLLFLPATVFAQATLAGVIRDSSEAVLPGVTVEVSSPAMIEKTELPSPTHGCPVDAAPPDIP